MGTPKIFISYKREHDATSRLLSQLEPALLEAGYEVLRDRDIEPGRPWSTELYNWLLGCSGAVVLVSRDAAKSDWCRREWSVLRAREAVTDLKVVPAWVEEGPGQTAILDDLQAVKPGPEQLERVLAALEGVKDAPPSADDYLAAHRGWLRWRFEGQSVLGREPFSLKDVYVETECGELEWDEISEQRLDPFDEKNGGRHHLIGAVMRHFGNPEFRDLVVVQGPAGSGKSCFTLRLADHLASEGLDPVLIRFRDMRLSSFTHVDELLQDAILVGPVDEDAPPPMEALFDDARLRQSKRLGDADVASTVILLDGWDEVGLTGSTSYKDQLEAWLPKIREYFVQRRGFPVRLLLTGRPSRDVDRSGLLRKETPVLTMRPMRPAQFRSFAETVSRELGRTDWSDRETEAWSLDLQRCEHAFRAYERGFGGQDEIGAEVFGSPLLSLLAFRTFAEAPEVSTRLLDQPTALYSALIETSVRNAGKADEGLEGTVHRGGRSLRRLLQRVASVISVQGVESVSFDELELRLEDDDALKEWVDDATSSGRLHELVVNFYFKGGNTDLGCEFLHKSFREYLFAEAIVAVLDEVSEGCRGAYDGEKVEYHEDFAPGSVEYRATRGLARLLAPQWLTSDVRTHLFWLVERGIKADPDRWTWIRDLLASVYRWWAEAVHLRPQARIRRKQRVWEEPAIVTLLEDAHPLDSSVRVVPVRATALDAHLGEALSQLTAFVHSRVRTTVRDEPLAYQLHDRGGEVWFCPGDGAWARELFARIESAGWRPGGGGLDGIVLPRVGLDREQLHGVSLRGARLEGASLERAGLDRATLRSANLRGAYFQGASLFNADLVSADLAGARLKGAYLVGADLSRANLSDADLAGSHLNGTTFSGADLQGANLSEVEGLESATLLGALYSEATVWPRGYVPRGDLCEDHQEHEPDHWHHH